MKEIFVYRNKMNENVNVTHDYISPYIISEAVFMEKWSDGMCEKYVRDDVNNLWKDMDGDSQVLSQLSE